MHLFTCPNSEDSPDVLDENWNELSQFLRSFLPTLTSLHICAGVSESSQFSQIAYGSLGISELPSHMHRLFYDLAVCSYCTALFLSMNYTENTAREAQSRLLVKTEMILIHLHICMQFFFTCL